MNYRKHKVFLKLKEKLLQELGLLSNHKMRTFFILMLSIVYILLQQDRSHEQTFAKGEKLSLPLMRRLFNLTSKQTNTNRMRYYLLPIRTEKLETKANIRLGENLKKNELHLTDGGPCDMLFDSEMEVMIGHGDSWAGPVCLPGQGPGSRPPPRRLLPSLQQNA